jgi:hypothetical protein
MYKNVIFLGETSKSAITAVIGFATPTLVCVEVLVNFVFETVVCVNEPQLVRAIATNAKIKNFFIVTSFVTLASGRVLTKKGCVMP